MTQVILTLSCPAGDGSRLPCLCSEFLDHGFLACGHRGHTGGTGSPEEQGCSLLAFALVGVPQRRL